MTDSDVLGLNDQTGWSQIYSLIIIIIIIIIV